MRTSLAVSTEANDLARAVRAAVFFAFIYFLVLIFQIEKANAQQSVGPTIFDVRRSLPLEPDEEVTKDFYINAGPESGLKKGVYVSVVRAVPVHDPIRNMQQATLNIPVGKVKVIDVQRGITVARLESELTDDDRPTLEFEGVMVGDQIDLGSVTTDEPKKPKAKRKKVAVVVPVAAPESESASDQGSAQAMAARAAAPPLVLAQPVAPVSSAKPANPVPSAASATSASAPTAVEMTTAADVKPEASPAPPSGATNNSSPADAKSEEAPKKEPSPKSAESDELNLEKPFKKSFPRTHATDTVRVADYTDAGF